MTGAGAGFGGRGGGSGSNGATGDSIGSSYNDGGYRSKNFLKKGRSSGGTPINFPGKKSNSKGAARDFSPKVVETINEDEDLCDDYETGVESVEMD